MTSDFFKAKHHLSVYVCERSNLTLKSAMCVCINIDYVCVLVSVCGRGGAAMRARVPAMNRQWKKVSNACLIDTCLPL